MKSSSSKHSPKLPTKKVRKFQLKTKRATKAFKSLHTHQLATFSTAASPTTTSSHTHLTPQQQHHQLQQQLPPPPLQQHQHQQPLSEHVFFRVDVSSYIFYNQIAVTFPDHTPSYIIQESQNALGEAFKNRPDCQNYQQNRLKRPTFQQFGSNWNRYEWSIRQKEIDGALDPLLIQTVLLDHFINQCGARFLSSTSATWFHRDSVTHILQFPIDQIDYHGTYHDCLYDADGAAV